MVLIPESLAIAAQYHQAGRLQDAEQICRQILASEPDQPDSVHLLGVIALQVGQPDMAVELIKRAIGLRGTEGVFHSNLGNVFLAQGKPDEAAACYLRALELKPELAEAHYNLGIALHSQGKLDEAIACHRQALELKPDFAAAHYNLGLALRGQAKPDEAIACYRRALELKPDLAEAHYNLGNTLHGQGKLDEAIACYRRTLELKPDLAEAHINLGNSLRDQEKLDESVACYRRALELKPDLAEAHYNLGVALHGQGKPDEAIAGYRRALELKPDLAEAHNNLGNDLETQGKPHEAAACYRRALELKPDLAEAQNNLGSIELDYVHRWLRAGGSLHRFDHIQDFDVYLKIDGWFDFQDIDDFAVAEARSGGVFVEVGCWMVRSTAYLGSRVAMAQKQVSIYAIDPWLGWIDGRPVSLFNQFLKNMDVAGLIDIVTPLRMMSAQAARLFDDRSVDFCFIDGDHKYKAVSEDLRCWFPKIRPGGLIGGHDYAGPDSLGVKRAVDEFFQRPVHVSGKSWLMRKEP